MIRCTACDHENVDGLEYCDNCGARLAEGGEEEAGVTSDATAADVPSEPDVGVETTTEEPASVGDGEAPIEVTAAPVEDTGGDDAPPAEPVADDAAVSGPEKAGLVITRGGTVGKEFPLQVGDNLVGRWDPDSGAFPEVDLESDDPEARISRRHALIRVAGDITIEDMGSLNGTFVNRGPRLEPGSPVTLKEGDEIIIGKTFLKVSLT